MTDQEFIELLNLYVDREISAEDAARLEAAVLASPRRRSIYNQYCRLQKACTMLSDQYAESAPEGEEVVFPATRSWRNGPFLAGLAAACLVAFVGIRFRGALATGQAPQVAAEAPRAAPAPAGIDLPRDGDSMQPVFFVRAPAPQAARGIASLFANSDVAPQQEQLNWIGDIHLTPVVFTTSPAFRLGPRPDLKPAVLSDSQDGSDSQESAEMTAFRFQR
jgi:Putative zinc-finger